MRTPLAALLLLAACASPPPEPPAPLAGQPMATGTIAGFKGPVTEFGTSVLVAGQPTPEGLGNARAAGVKVVIDLRPQAEQTYDEGQVVTGLGMEYVALPVTVESLTDAQAAGFVESVKAARRRLEPGERMLVHCQSGNRAAGLWAIYEIAEGPMSAEEAVGRARKAGLKSGELVAFIGEWTRRRELKE